MNPRKKRFINGRQHFEYSYDQAVNEIKRRGASLGRLVISHKNWEEMREAKEAQGFDKDAYERFLETRPQKSTTTEPPLLSQGTAPAT